MKKHFASIILVSIFFVGLSVLLYPALSNYWNSKTQSRAIVNYEDILADLKPEDFSALFAQANDYNAKIRRNQFPLVNPDRLDEYNRLLNVAGNGMMGYISIEKIKVELPIYHNVSDAVLNVATGHFDWSSLPVGGPGTHSVITAHRGLPSASLFTKLDKLEVGDTFTLTVLNKVLTYEVDQILIVEPDELNDLFIAEGKDFCTLLTCTPYGINTQRLLVRGTRIEGDQAKPALYLPADAYRIDPLIVTPMIAAPMLLVLLVILLVKYRTKKDEV
ncbi:class C sortase [Dehalobacterium formicoaceticum]|uniref:Class C sortase n=1 Tax=Dehalobacterium formicoaceticum TaxID=51515 RepID=A0ABT1Y4J8_9FIRM|nr:class C sortase [Dehalobacterium formicoaceticum]MCR6545065.1 class C sortase [Dehalobacterium formicoaceticum]